VTLKRIRKNAAVRVNPPAARSDGGLGGYREDGWRNLISGLGVRGVDKRLAAGVCHDHYTQAEAEIIWRGDDLGGRIVEAVPNEMTREGYRLKTDATDIAAQVTAHLDDLEHMSKLRQALEYRRAYGGGAVLLGADDGQRDLGRPLDETRVRSFDWATVLTPREIRPVVWYEDPRAPKYGEPELYELTPDMSILSGRVFVHESRILAFGGVRTSTRAIRMSSSLWGDSVFDRVAAVLRDFQTAYGGAFALIPDFAQAVLKVKGLAEMVASEDPADASAFSARIRAFDYTRSALRTAVLDSEEEFERKATPLSGLADILDKFMLRLAAACDMPVSLLMGQSPAGLNATGEADIRFFYDRIRAHQKNTLRPALNRMVKITMRALGLEEPDGWAVVFNPLWQLDAAQEATARKTNAEADQLYFSMGVLAPHEIRMSRFGREEYGTEIQLDDETQAALEAPDLGPDGQPLPVQTPRVAVGAGAPAGDPSPAEPEVK
jgi:phage-related protein (TIGR01555 family)